MQIGIIVKNVYGLLVSPIATEKTAAIDGKL